METEVCSVPSLSTVKAMISLVVSGVDNYTLNTVSEMLGLCSARIEVYNPGRHLRITSQHRQLSFIGVIIGPSLTSARALTR